MDDYTAGKPPEEWSVPDPKAGLHILNREQERRKRVHCFRRTHKAPFEGKWEQIFSWLVTNPERSSGDIFRELKRRSPGRYHPLQIRTLLRGMRKIRAHLLETVEEQWPRRSDPWTNTHANRVSREGHQEFLTTG